MENNPFSEFLNNKEFEIREKLAFAKKHALSPEEQKEAMDKEREMQGIQQKRELTSPEVEYYYTFREKMNAATIEVETLPEARRTMELLGLNYDAIIDTLSHENAHGNKAEQLGADHIGYKFLLTREPGGRLGVHPQAYIYIPDEWDKETQKAVLSEVTWAPEDYGNSLSDDDKKDLEQLYNDEN